MNEKLMEKRQLKEEIMNTILINPSKLHLYNYNKEINQLESILNAEEKLCKMTNYLENEIQINDIFSVLQYEEEEENMDYNKINDLTKYYLLLILLIIDGKNFKKFFPDKDPENYSLIIDKDKKPLSLSRKFFQVLFVLFSITKEKDVKNTIIELFYNYAYYSYNFLDYCYEDIRYLQKLFSIGYEENPEMLIDFCYIFNALISYNNKNEDGNYDDEIIHKILQMYPLVQRCEELLKKNIPDYCKIEVLDLMRQITRNVDSDTFPNYFYNSPSVFYNYMASQVEKKNETTILLILKVLKYLSLNNQLCREIINSKLGKCLFHILEIKDLQADFLYYLLEILGNMFYENDIIEYYIQIGIITIFINILNTYKNAGIGKNELNLLGALLFCLSNFASGKEEAISRIVKSDIPDLVKEVMIINQNNNKIYFEGVNFFYNIIENGDYECFCKISELNPLKLFGYLLEHSGIYEHEEICLKGILLLTEKNKNIYGTLQNLKNQYYACGIKRKMNEIYYSTKKDLSKIAEIIIKNYEDKMISDDNEINMNK